MIFPYIEAVEEMFLEVLVLYSARPQSSDDMQPPALCTHGFR